jgi:hypothetical protein
MARDDPDLLLNFSPTVEVGGMSYPLIGEKLEYMRVTERQGGMSSLELVMADSAAQGDGSALHAAGAGSPLQLGAGIRLFGGPAERNAAELFDGQITAIEAEVRDAAAPLFTVLAEDRLFPLRRLRRTRLHESMKLADVVSAIAEDHRLKPEVRDGIDETARNWMQADETDLAFLRRILSRFDADVQIVADKLQVGRVGMDQRTPITLHAGTTLKYARITADIAEQVTAIRLASFDPETGEPVDANEAGGGFGPGKGKSGADILNEKFSAVVMHLGRNGPLTSADATAIAQTECNRRARAFVRACGTTRGDPGLRVGSWITLVGVNPQFANDYAVTHAVHRWNLEEGYLTDFEAECAYLGEAQ